MRSLRVLLALLLVQHFALGQSCVVNSTEPPVLTFPDGTIVAWPKTNLMQAPSYVGHVEYYINCTYSGCPRRPTNELRILAAHVSQPRQAGQPEQARNCRVQAVTCWSFSDIRFFHFFPSKCFCISKTLRCLRIAASRLDL